MHDEVSETENIRKNLAIERMIVEGCEVLLDTSQTFVRQGMFQVEEARNAIVCANPVTALPGKHMPVCNCLTLNHTSGPLCTVMVTWVGLDCSGLSFYISDVLLYIQTPVM